MARPTTSRSNRTAPQTDHFEELLGSVKSEPKKKTTKKERDGIELTPEETETFNRFVKSYILFKKAEGKQKSLKNQILPALVDKVYNNWCDSGCRTDNPRIRTDIGNAIVQIREQMKLDLPEDETIEDLLVRGGFTEAQATIIKEREIKEEKLIQFTDLNKLRETTSGKALVGRLSKVITDTFSPEERNQLFKTVTHIEVNQGVLDRAVSHVDCDHAKLKVLLSIIKPTSMFSNVHLDLALQEAVLVLEEKEEEGQGGSTTTSTPVTPAEFVSNDNKWKAVATGNTATLFRVEEGAERLLFSRSCNTPDHAKMTCQKWSRDAEYRAEAIAKFAIQK